MLLVFRDLEILAVNDNNIAMLPDALFQLTKIRELNAGYNCIKELIGPMQQLENLQVQTNEVQYEHITHVGTCIGGVRHCCHSESDMWRIIALSHFQHVFWHSTSPMLLHPPAEGME